MPNEDLGNCLRVERRTLRLTQADLASAVGVSRQTIVAIEGGDYAPSVLLALRIAAALDTTVDHLFFIDPAHQEVP